MSNLGSSQQVVLGGAEDTVSIITTEPALQKNKSNDSNIDEALASASGTETVTASSSLEAALLLNSVGSALKMMDESAPNNDGPVPAPQPLPCMVHPSTAASISSSSPPSVSPVYWTPIQRIQQINEYWAAASLPPQALCPSPLSKPAMGMCEIDALLGKTLTEGFGSMTFWQRFVDEFFEEERTVSSSSHGSSPGTSSSSMGDGGDNRFQLLGGEVGLLLTVQEAAFPHIPCSPSLATSNAAPVAATQISSTLPSKCGDGKLVNLHERFTTSTSTSSASSSSANAQVYHGIGVPRRPYFIPRSLLPRFFWTMAGGVENPSSYPHSPLPTPNTAQNGGKKGSSAAAASAQNESPMTRCHLRMQRVREVLQPVTRRPPPASTLPNHLYHSSPLLLLLLEPAESVLQISRLNGLQTEQSGSLRLWFAIKTGKIVRWEWSVESACEWRMTIPSWIAHLHHLHLPNNSTNGGLYGSANGSGSTSGSSGHGKRQMSTRLIAGFTSRTWGVLEVQTKLENNLHPIF